MKKMQSGFSFRIAFAGAKMQGDATETTVLAALEKLGGMDVSKETLPFMQWADGTLGGFPARVYRISFSGELSYEVAVPASMGLADLKIIAAIDKAIASGKPEQVER